MWQLKSVENPQNEHTYTELMYITLKSATSYMLHKFTLFASVCEVPSHMITLHKNKNLSKCCKISVRLKLFADFNH